jgi:hypothetical protein
VERANQPHDDKVHSEMASPVGDEPEIKIEQTLQDDYLDSVAEIAKFLGWTARKVRYARETGALPIRVKSGVGLYAFKSEILAALKTPDTLAPQSPHKAH